MNLLRARDDGAKRQRRRQLLAAAATRLDAVGYEATTMAEVATEARLAKGTTYLYFRSKEALFLELLLEAVAEWRTAAAAALGDEADEDGGLDATAAALAATVAERPRLVRLLALLHPVLESGAGVGAVLAFRRRLLELLAPLAENLERRFPALGAAEGIRFLLRFQALVAGLADLAQPAAQRRDALAADPQLAVYDRDFATELGVCLAALLRGSGATPPGP